MLKGCKPIGRLPDCIKHVDVGKIRVNPTVGTDRPHTDPSRG